MSLAGKSSHGENENVIVVVHRSRCQIAAFYRYFRAVIRRLGEAQSIINRSAAGQQRPASIPRCGTAPRRGHRRLLCEYRLRSISSMIAGAVKFVLLSKGAISIFAVGRPY